MNAAGNGGFLLATVDGSSIDIPSPLIRVAGVGGIGLNGDVKNALNWAPRVGITYQLTEKTTTSLAYSRQQRASVQFFRSGFTVDDVLLGVGHILAEDFFHIILTVPAPQQFCSERRKF